MTADVVNSAAVAPVASDIADARDAVVEPTAAFDQFRQRARALLAAGVPPGAAQGTWGGCVDGARRGAADLFAADSSVTVHPSAVGGGSSPAVPRSFIVKRAAIFRPKKMQYWASKSVSWAAKELSL